MSRSRPVVIKLSDPLADESTRTIQNLNVRFHGQRMVDERRTFLLWGTRFD